MLEQGPFVGIGDGSHLILKTRYFTAPGTVEGALTHLRDNPPAGFAVGSYGSVGTPGGPDVTKEIDFDPVDDVSDFIQQSVVSYVVTAHGDGVAVRYDVQAVWTPNRTQPMTLTDVTAAQVRVTVTSADPNQTVPAPVTVDLPADRLATLVSLVNQQPAWIAMPHPCPPSVRQVQIVVTFRSAAHTWQLDGTSSVCGSGADLRRDGTELPQLRPSPELSRAFLAAAGLPADYGIAGTTGPTLLTWAPPPGDSGARPAALVSGKLAVNDAGCVTIGSALLIAPPGSTVSADGTRISLAGRDFTIGDSPEGLSGGYGELGSADAPPGVGDCRSKDKPEREYAVVNEH